jgi:hypothetical protein
MRTITFDDKGPDEDGRRRFTLTWPIEPMTFLAPAFAGGPMRKVTVRRRGQCFHSAQWRDFIDSGFVVTEKAPKD